MFRFLDLNKIRQHFSGCETLTETELFEILSRVFKEMVKVLIQLGWEKNNCFPLYEQNVEESFKKGKVMFVAFFSDEEKIQGIGIFGPEAEMDNLPYILEILTQQSIERANLKKLESCPLNEGL